MKKYLTVFLLAGLALPTFSSCVPTSSGITVTPQLVQVSASAAPGQSVVLQGRYLGGPATAQVRLGADENGNGGYIIPAAAIVSWTDTRIEFRMPAGAPAGGGWAFVEVAGRRSTGLPFSVKAG